MTRLCVIHHCFFTGSGAEGTLVTTLLHLLWWETAVVAGKESVD